MFKRLICCVKGHRGFPTPPEPGLEKAQSVIGGGPPPGSYLAAGNVNMAHSTSMTWLTPAEATLQITRGPFNASFAICARCHHVYWKREPHLATIVDSRNMPELNDYHKFREREAIERRGRENNPLAAKLYQQYQVALKLVGDGK